MDHNMVNMGGMERFQEERARAADMMQAANPGAATPSSVAPGNFVWDEASGLYFDEASGFYHDARAGWYYNGHDSTYYSYEDGKFIPLPCPIIEGEEPGNKSGCGDASKDAGIPNYGHEKFGSVGFEGARGGPFDVRRDQVEGKHSDRVGEPPVGGGGLALGGERPRLSPSMSGEREQERLRDWRTGGGSEHVGPEGWSRGRAMDESVAGARYLGMGVSGRGVSHFPGGESITDSRSRSWMPSGHSRREDDVIASADYLEYRERELRGRGWKGGVLGGGGTVDNGVLRYPRREEYRGGREEYMGREELGARDEYGHGRREEYRGRGERSRREEYRGREEPRAREEFIGREDYRGEGSESWRYAGREDAKRHLRSGSFDRDRDERLLQEKAGWYSDAARPPSWAVVERGPSSKEELLRLERFRASAPESYDDRRISTGRERDALLHGTGALWPSDGHRLPERGGVRDDGKLGRIPSASDLAGRGTDPLDASSGSWLPQKPGQTVTTEALQHTLQPGSTGVPAQQPAQQPVQQEAQGQVAAATEQQPAATAEAVGPYGSSWQWGTWYYDGNTGVYYQYEDGNWKVHEGEGWGGALPNGESASTAMAVSGQPWQGGSATNAVGTTDGGTATAAGTEATKETDGYSEWQYDYTQEKYYCVKGGYRIYWDGGGDAAAAQNDGAPVAQAPEGSSVNVTSTAQGDTYTKEATTTGVISAENKGSEAAGEEKDDKEEFVEAQRPSSWIEEALTEMFDKGLPVPPPCLERERGDGILGPPSGLPFGAIIPDNKKDPVAVGAVVAPSDTEIGSIKKTVYQETDNYKKWQERMARYRLLHRKAPSSTATARRGSRSSDTASRESSRVPVPSRRGPGWVFRKGEWIFDGTAKLDKEKDGEEAEVQEEEKEVKVETETKEGKEESAPVEKDAEAADESEEESESSSGEESSASEHDEWDEAKEEAGWSEDENKGKEEAKLLKGKGEGDPSEGATPGDHWVQIGKGRYFRWVSVGGVWKEGGEWKWEEGKGWVEQKGVLKRKKTDGKDEEEPEEEKKWKEQYGQGVSAEALKSKPKKEDAGNILDLWDWAVVERGKGKKRDANGKDLPSLPCLSGKVAAAGKQLHPSLAGSGFIKTCPIKETKRDLVRVTSGRVYRLRRPHVNHLAALAAQGSTYKESDPTAGWGYPLLPDVGAEEPHAEEDGGTSSPGRNGGGSAEKKLLDSVGTCAEFRAAMASEVGSAVIMTDTGMKTLAGNTSKASAVAQAASNAKAMMYRDRAAERRKLHGLGTGPGQRNQVVAELMKKAEAAEASYLEKKAESMEKKKRTSMERIAAGAIPTPTIGNDVGWSRYRDRAAERRKLYGGFGTGPGQRAPGGEEEDKTDPAQVDDPMAGGATPVGAGTIPIGSGNRGKQMLKGMGWREGDSLGSTTTGITTPISAIGNQGRAGLGWS